MVRPDPVDPELVSALLDGALSPADRAQVLERLARSPEDYELFAEAAGVLRDLDADGAGAPPRPVALPASPPSAAATRPRRRMPPARIWLPLAAVLAGALLLPRLAGRGGGSAQGLLDGRTLVAARGNGSLAAALGPGLRGPEGSSTRGSAESRADEGREFEIGVGLARVEVAFDAGDATAAKDLLRELREPLGRILGGGPTVAEYEALEARVNSGARVDDLESDRIRARENLSALLQGSPWFELGSWAEQARLAALANQAGFFSGRAVRVLDRLADEVAEKRGEGTPLARWLREIQLLLADGAAPGELDAIHAALAGVMEEGGG